MELNDLTVHNDLEDPGSTSLGVPPGEYGLYLDLNGRWLYLNDLAPGLDSVFEGQSFDLDTTLDIYVPAGESVRLEVDGRECDLPRIKPCPVTSEVAEDNDSPGTAVVEFPSAEDAVGQHVIQPTEQSPNYELDYEVRELSPARLGPPEGVCVDTFPPRSRIGLRPGLGRSGAPHGSHASRDRIELRGRAHDPACHGRVRGVRAVEVAIAKRAGERCRFVQDDGELGHRDACEARDFLEASGRRRWRLAVDGPFPPGRYVSFSRSSDRAGNVEAPLGKRNRAGFAIR